MVRVMQEKGNKRAPKSMGRWQLARLDRLRVELVGMEETYNEAFGHSDRWRQLKLRERQLARALERDAARVVAIKAPKGWRCV